MIKAISKNYKNILKEFAHEQKGQTLIEWILILAVILVVVMVALISLGKSAKKKADDIDKVLK